MHVVVAQLGCVLCPKLKIFDSNLASELCLPMIIWYTLPFVWRHEQSLAFLFHTAMITNLNGRCKSRQERQTHGISLKIGLSAASSS